MAEDNTIKTTIPTVTTPTATDTLNTQATDFQVETDKAATTIADAPKNATAEPVVAPQTTPAVTTTAATTQNDPAAELRGSTANINFTPETTPTPQTATAADPAVQATPETPTVTRNLLPTEHLGQYYDTETTIGSAGGTFVGGATKDYINGSKKDDVIDAGAGDDHLNGNEGNDILIGGAGTDRMFGGAGNDTLMGGADRDNMWGGEGDDILDGGSTEEILGADNVNNMSGGTGNDTFRNTNRGTVDGGLGNDTFEINGNSSDYTIKKDVEYYQGGGRSEGDYSGAYKNPYAVTNNKTRETVYTTGVENVKFNDQTVVIANADEGISPAPDLTLKYGGGKLNQVYTKNDSGGGHNDIITKYALINKYRTTDNQVATFDSIQNPITRGII